MLSQSMLDRLPCYLAAKLAGRNVAHYVFDGQYHIYAGDTALVALAHSSRSGFRRAADGVWVANHASYRPGSTTHLIATMV
jgi:hypothetical protein